MTSQATRPQQKDYKHTVSFPMHWGEMDAFQHLNNTIFFRYFETGRGHFFGDIMVERNTSGAGPILAYTSCQYIRPVIFPDQVTVGTRLKSMGNTSFVLEHALFSEKAGLVALGEAVIVMFDYHKEEKIPISDEIKALLAEKG